MLTVEAATDPSRSSGEVSAAVRHALKAGYRHLDCAYVYGNESEVGQGIRDAEEMGIKREDVFVTRY